MPATTVWIITLLKNSLNDLYASGAGSAYGGPRLGKCLQIEDFWYAPDPDYPDEQEHLRFIPFCTAAISAISFKT